MSDPGVKQAGVYPSQWLGKAIGERHIRSRLALPAQDRQQLQPGSLDLRLGEWAYRLRCSFLPSATETVEEKLAQYALDRPVDIREGGILERNRPYLIPLEEELALPEHLWGKCNPKSSIGRLDIFTRVITDRNPHFDELRAGYRGRLYLEVFSRTFTIKIRKEQSLNQLRLVAGAPRLSDDDLRSRHRDEALVRRDGEPVPDEELSVGNGLFLSLDLKGGDDRLVGYKARKNSKLLDLTADVRHDPEEFWEGVEREKDGHRLVLEPEEFYLLMSRESVTVPPDLAAEMSAYDPTSGELRTHYAGFFDPGFGFDPSGAHPGARAVLEVRAHDVPFVVEHGQRICRLAFERMLERPEILYGHDIGSAYQYQAAMLSKHFEQHRTERRPR